MNDFSDKMSGVIAAKEAPKKPNKIDAKNAEPAVIVKQKGARTFSPRGDARDAMEKRVDAEYARRLREEYRDIETLMQVNVQHVHLIKQLIKDSPLRNGAEIAELSKVIRENNKKIEEKTGESMARGYPIDPKAA